MGNDIQQAISELCATKAHLFSLSVLIEVKSKLFVKEKKRLESEIDLGCFQKVLDHQTVTQSRRCHEKQF